METPLPVMPAPPAKFFRAKKIILAASLTALFALLCVGGYFGLEYYLEWYMVRSAKTLIEQEKNGELSREYGYVWSEINLAKRMQKINSEILGPGSDSSAMRDTGLTQAPKHVYSNIPSLAAVAELNKILQASNYILITDRYDYPLAEIKTTHTRLPLNEFNDVLIKAIICSEDRNFYTRTLAYEYKAFVRAFFRSILHGLASFSFPRPKGTSTIHQQVAKFLLSRFDSRGYVYSERSISRKIRELKLAQALKMYYSQDELLQLYLNHCVNAGYGMTGYYDISMGLFGKKPAELDICQSLYLARLVKWNRNIPKKIMAQIRIDMPRTAPVMGWPKPVQDSILAALSLLKFQKPVQIASDHNPLIDLANEYWLKVCRKNGMPEDEIADMDFSQANTMIRRKGNLKIQLFIDLRLQKQLEALVDKRGFGRDTVIYTDVRIGSAGADVRRSAPPRDTLRRTARLKADTAFSEPGSRFSFPLHQGDTLVSNIRYKKKDGDLYRRAAYFYRRDTLHVPGQYFAYAVMNSKTGELLAYYSRDGIGSRLSSLLKNKTPNGSSVAKPILYALNYDLGHFQPDEMESDSVEVAPPAAWARKFLAENSRNVGMVYQNTSATGGYPVSNHGKIFEGYDYVFNHLTESNNILCVEMIYRLNSSLFGEDGNPLPESGPVMQLLNRLGDTVIIGGDKKPRSVTGTQIYARIAGVTGAEVDSVMDMRGKIPLPPDYYSVALGTLELSLYQEMHLFNVLYNNEIIADPQEHPGLVIKSISMSGGSIAFSDSIGRRSLFSDMEKIKPALLGLHQRLVSNAADGLEKYDIPADSAFRAGGTLAGPLSNFAKSGTSDDIIRPFNTDVVAKARTNYGLWNAALRLELTAGEYSGMALKRVEPVLTGDSARADSIPEKETLDITLSCVGECNERNTGARDGKSLHKYVSAGFLHAYGIPVDSGFYKIYGQRLASETPDTVLYRNPYEKPVIDSALLSEIIRKTAGVRFSEELLVKKGIFFGIYISDEVYFRLLSLTAYMGKEAEHYHALVEKLEEARKSETMLPILEEMKGVSGMTPPLEKIYRKALGSLVRSAVQSGR